MAWNYAELSKLAKANGGPEKLVEILVKSGEKKVLPWVGVAVAGGVALTIGVQKIIDYFSRKKAISTAEVELAKMELIQGIKDYDAANEELIKIITRFAESDWDLINEPSKAWLDGKKSNSELLPIIKQAEKECGSCGCEFDPLYKRALALLNT